MRVLGFDPGVTNFAYAVYDTDTQVVVAMGWIRGHGVNDNDHGFIDSVVTALDNVKPDLVGIERFAMRTHTTWESEPINQMIGKLDLLCRMRGYKTTLIMPAHWKVRYHTKDLLNGSKDLFPGTVFDAIHQADAAGIAKYVYEAGKDKAEKAEKKLARATAKAARASAPKPRSARKRQPVATVST